MNKVIAVSNVRVAFTDVDETLRHTLRTVGKSNILLISDVCFMELTKRRAYPLIFEMTV